MHHERAEHIVVRGLGEMLRRILEKSSVELSESVRRRTEAAPPAPAGVPPAGVPPAADRDSAAASATPSPPSPSEADAFIGGVSWQRALRAPASFEEEKRRVTSWLQTRLAAS